MSSYARTIAFVAISGALGFGAGRYITDRGTPGKYAFISRADAIYRLDTRSGEIRAVVGSNGHLVEMMVMKADQVADLQGYNFSAK